MAASETPQQEYERLYGKGSAQPKESPEEEYRRIQASQSVKQETPEEEFNRLYNPSATKQEPTFASRFAGKEDVEEYKNLPEALHPAKTALNVTRSALSGEAVPMAVNWVKHLFGDEGEKTGATVARELDIERRGGGMLPEYRALSGGPVDQTVQGLANLAGGVVGMVGAIPALATEALTMAGRDVGRAAGGLVTDIATAAYRHGIQGPAKNLFGDISANALAHQQQDGHWRTLDAAKESMQSKGEFLKGASFGASPGIYEAFRALAHGEDPVDAAWEAFKSYPLETILPFYHGVVKPAMQVKGAPIERGGAPLQTVTGKQLVLNPAGERVFEPVTRVAETKVVKELKGAVGDTVREALDWGQRVVEPEWQRVAFDVVTPRTLSRQKAMTEANKAVAVAESESARRMKDAVTMHNLLRDIDAELADPNFVNKYSGQSVGSNAIGFKTEFGSSYIVHPDGTTTRTKAARNIPGHIGDSGIKPQSQTTLYVEKDIANALNATGSSNQVWRYGIEPKSQKITRVDWNEFQNRWGVSPSARSLDYKTTPEVGLVPVELWDYSNIEGTNLNGFKKVHFGNKIIELSSNKPSIPNTITAAEKFAAIEGTLKDTDLITQAPVIDKNSRATAQALGEKFVELGMTPEDAQMAIPYTLFEGVRAAKKGVINDPFKTLTDLQGQLSNMDQATAAKFTEAYAANVRAQMNNPAFLAAADQAWSGKGYSWVPGAELRQRDGYAQAMRAVQAKAQETGKPTFELNIPELGELRKDYVYKLYDNLVDSIRSSPEGRERVAHLLASNPISRMAANPTAPVHIQALAAWSNQPGGKRRQLMDLLNQAGMESARNMGHDPLVIAKHYDRYLSRAFTDAIDGAVKLDDYIKLMADDPETAIKAGKDFASSRYKRKISEKTSNQRFTEMVAKGDISLHDALAATVVNSMAMNSHLAAMAELHDALKAQGILSDTQKPGYVQLSTEKAAPSKQAASKGEYNLAYGKLGGKWVDPWVARQMGLMPEGFKALSETMPALQFLNNFSAGMLGLMRTTHTQFNAPLYGLRNAIQDPLPAMAASGLSPYAGEGKKMMRAAQADTDRFVRTRDNPGGAVLSPRLREMVDVGLFDPDKMPAMTELPVAVRDQVKHMALNINRTTIEATNPAEHVNLLARAVAHTRALGKTIKTDVPKAFLQALKDSNEDRKAAIASGEANIPAAIGGVSKYLQHANQHLNDTALALSLAQAEQTRAAWVYNVARDHLKLDKDRAAIFVRETMYGHERPSPQMVAIMNSLPALAGVVPLFLRYGLWQTQRFTQRTLAHPHLWASYAIAKGLDAVNENELLSEPNGESNWKHRLAEIHTKHTAVADVGLNTVGGIQEAGKLLGAPESLLKTLGHPEDPVTVGLSDLIGGQTFLHQIDPRKTGFNYIFQLGLFGGNLAQLADPNKKLEGVSDIGLAPGEEGLWPVAREVGKGISAKVMPASQVINYGGLRIPVPMGRTIQALAGLAVAAKKGDMPYRNAYGDKVNPANEIAKALGPGMPNVIDSVAAMRSISKTMHRQAMQFNMDLSEHKLKRVDPNLKNELKEVVLTENGINSAAKKQQMRLSLAWQYSFLTRAEALAASKQMEELRKKAIEDVRKGGTGGAVLSDMFDDPKINAASDAVTKAMMDAGEEILDDEKED